MAKYHSLSPKLVEQIKKDRQEHWVNPYAFCDEDVIRRRMDHDRANLWRPAFVRDVEKIMHVPYYNRYSDKTQVFSLYKNDDISRRAQHVQIVSRIARNIGSVLALNTDLIEAIALGHDIGHTPFGHPGERKLSELFEQCEGKFFNHNIHSARVLDTILPTNLSLQTLDGIICHNGEMESQNYRPVSYSDFALFDRRMKDCYCDKGAVKKLVPSTMEACVVRVSDIIAYLGKDRQDAQKLNILPSNERYSPSTIGTTNSEIINNLIVNILENSYRKDCLKMDLDYYEAFSNAKSENYRMIYGNEQIASVYEKNINPMIERMFEHFLKDAKEHNKKSYLYEHHVKYVKEITSHYPIQNAYLESCTPAELVVDYIASMTDDYFVDLYEHLFLDSKYKVEYIGYFYES